MYHYLNQHFIHILLALIRITKGPLVSLSAIAQYCINEWLKKTVTVIKYKSNKFNNHKCPVHISDHMGPVQPNMAVWACQEITQDLILLGVVLIFNIMT